MMNRGLGSMFYGGVPVQYMRGGGMVPVQYMQAGGLSGWGTMAEANKTAAAQTTREPVAYTSTRAATPARESAQASREPAQVTREVSGGSSWREDRDESPSDLERAYSQLASSMREAGVSGLGQTTSPFDRAGDLRVRTFGAPDGFLVEQFPELTRDVALRAAPASAPTAAPVSTAGLSRNMYGDVYGSAPSAAPVSTAGLSRPAYGDVSPVAGRVSTTRDDRAPAGTYGGTGVTFDAAYSGDTELGIPGSFTFSQPSGGTSAPSAPIAPVASMPVETLTGGQFGAGQVVAPPPRPEEPGFFQGLGQAIMALPGAMADDFSMGMTLMLQGEDAFIEKYGADALADFKRRTADTIARNEAQFAAGADGDVFEACPEGFERDPVTQMCVPIPVKTEEEKPEEETKPEATPSSAETLQDVINRITVGGGGTQPIVAGGGQNVLPGVDFFRPQLGVRRMQAGGAVDYRAAARAAAEQFGVRPDLYERLILRESNFDPMARSEKGAMGLAQVMPATARDPGFGVTPLANPMDPNESLRFGAEYLSALIREFGGDEKKAVAAYNAGVGRVRKAGGVPDIQETRDYVDFILGGRGPVTAPPPRPANLAQKGGVRQADVARAVEALTPARRAPVEAPPMRPRPTMTSAERMSQLQGGMSGDSLSRAVDSVLSSLMR